MNKIQNKKGIALAVYLIGVPLLCFGLIRYSLLYQKTDSVAVIPSTSDAEWEPWLKEQKVQVSAIVFYGRRRYVRILEKYIKPNLVSNGGLLEEVLWIVRTDDQDDLNWLQQTLLPSEPRYRSLQSSGQGFEKHYRQLESGRYYVKLDDDIVYIKHGAIEAMLHEKLKNRFWVVSANVINHPVLTFVHAAMGTMRTYELRNGDFVPAKGAKQQAFLDGSEFENMAYEPYDKCGLHKFACVATVHYNFLSNEARDELDLYNFGSWDFHAFKYQRWSINTIMFKGSDLNREDISEDDEESIAVVLPRTKGRHCGAVGAAIVVHLAYVTQRGEGFEEKVQVLRHYEELAQRLHGPLLPV